MVLHVQFRVVSKSLTCVTWHISYIMFCLIQLCSKVQSDAHNICQGAFIRLELRSTLYTCSMHTSEYPDQWFSLPSGVVRYVTVVLDRVLHLQLDPVPLALLLAKKQESLALSPDTMLSLQRLLPKHTAESIKVGCSFTKMNWGGGGYLQHICITVIHMPSQNQITSLY